MKKSCRHPQTLRVALVLAMIAGGLLAFVAAPGQAKESAAAPLDTPERRVKFMTYNISGGQLYFGSSAPINSVLAEIRSADNFDVVMLQEVCQNQFNYFQSQLPDWSMIFEPTDGPNLDTYDHLNGRQSLDSQAVEAAGDIQTSKCPGAPFIGEVLASPYPLIPVQNICTHKHKFDTSVNTAACETTLPASNSVPCATILRPDLVPGSLKACTVHLPAIDSHFGAMTRAIAQALPEAGGSQTGVIIGGDFNEQPHKSSMNELYRLTKSGSLSGQGNFFEADQQSKNWFSIRDDEVSCGANDCRSGRPTSNGYSSGNPTCKSGLCRKIDYAFFSRGTTNRNSMSMAVKHRHPTNPQHGMIVAQAGMRLPVVN